MAEDVLAPFLAEGASPQVPGTVESRPVLAVDRPWVAFTTGKGENGTLWVSDYHTEEIVCSRQTSARPVAFGPDGTLLLAEPSGEALLLAEPWQTPRSIPGVFTGPKGDVAWITSDTLLALVYGGSPTLIIAGHPVFRPPSVLLASVHTQTVQSRDVQRWSSLAAATWQTELRSAACSASGRVALLVQVRSQVSRLVVFSVDFPEVVTVGPDFQGPLPWNQQVTISQDGSHVAVVGPSWRGGSLYLFRIDDARRTLESAGTSTAIEGFEGLSFAGGVLVAEVWPGISSERARVVRVLSLKAGGYESVYDGSVQGTSPISCSVELDGQARFAVGDGDRVRIFMLNDSDVVQLASEDVERAVAAAQRVGQRGLARARMPLESLLSAERSDLRAAAVVSLGMLAAPESAPALIRLLGQRRPLVDVAAVKAAIDRIDRPHLAEALSKALRGNAPERRGGVRYLSKRPYVEALEALHECLSDVDPETRLCAADALGKVAELRAVLPLLGALGDQEGNVRDAAQRALTRTLSAHGFLTEQVAATLTLPLDLRAFAQDVIDAGWLPAPSGLPPCPAACFLSALRDSIAVHSSLDDLRNAIERLALPRSELPSRSAKAVGAVVTLVFAEGLASRRDWAAAASTYAYAAGLAEAAQASNLLWKCWKALAECHEALKQDRLAADAYARAMETIDRLWFALLEEGVLQGFFAEKADLYERAALCNLRLGHAALALECLEKAKTRYLGDLIARRHKSPTKVLSRDLSILWRLVDEQTPERLAIMEIGSDSERVMITGVRHDNSPATHLVVRPEKLVRLEQSLQVEGGRTPGWGIQAMWNLAAQLMALEVLPEEQSEPLSELYGCVKELNLDVRTSDLTQDNSEAARWKARFRVAIDRLLKVGSEFGFLHDLAPTIEQWVGERDELDEWSIHLEALVEPLDLILGRELVHGRTALEDPELPRAVSGLRFDYATLSFDQADLSSRTATVQRAFERLSTGKWRYLSRLARGDVASFQRGVELISSTPGTAQVHFAVTNQGTVAYVTLAEHTGRGRSRAPFAGPADHLEVLSMPDLTLARLRDHLIDRGWLKRDTESVGRGGMRHWGEVMEPTLERLSDELWKPVHEVLLRHDVKRVRIIPHRVLHLIPFAALPVGRGLRGVRRLVDVFDIHLAPSLTLYDICCQRTAGVSGRPPIFTAVCDPTENLNFATIEVPTQVDRLGNRPNVLKRKEATLKALAGTELGSYFHFAGHAAYNSGDPLDSYLEFHDKKLTLEDLYAESLPVHGLALVTLSACETSVVSSHDLADEWLGLASGFLFGGARCVISTLWAVSDQASAVLLSKFYEYYFAGRMPADRALGKAQRWVRDSATPKTAADAIHAAIAELRTAMEQTSDVEAKQAFAQRIDRLEQSKAGVRSRGRRPFAHPYFWAGFTLSGYAD